MKTTDMTPRELSIAKRAAAEYLARVKAGMTYDVAKRAWVEMNKYVVDGCDVVAAGVIISRRQSPLAAAEHAAYLNWRELVEHPPYPAPEFEAADAAAEEAAHAAWVEALNRLNSEA